MNTVSSVSVNFDELDANSTLSWCQHPINVINKEIEEFKSLPKKSWCSMRPRNWATHESNKLLCERYLSHLLSEGYITNSEFEDIILIPYRGQARRRTLDKTNIEAHKLLFLCEERELFPLILKLIIKYMKYLFDDGFYRRQLVLDVIHLSHESIRPELYRMFRAGCRLGDAISKFQLNYIYSAKPLFAKGYSCCRVDRYIVCTH